MTTKLRISIEDDGMCSMTLISFIGKHNAGKQNISLDDLKSICRTKQLEYPACLNNMIVEDVENGIVIKEDGKNVTCIIEERIVEELVSAA